MAGKGKFEARDRPSPGGDYRRLLTYAWPYRWVFLAGVLAMFISGASEAGFAALLKPIMDEGFVNRDQAVIRMTPIILMAVFVVRGIAGFIDGYCVQWVGRKIIYDLRADMFRRMIHLPMAHYDNHPTSELVSKLIFDVEQVAQASTTAVRIVFKDTFTAIILLGWLAWLSWQLTLVFLAIAPVIAFLVNKMSKRFRYTSTRIQDSMGDITQVAKEAFQGHQVIKVFGGYTAEEKKFDVANRGNRRFSMRKAGVSAASVPIIMFVAGIAVSIIIFFAMGGAGGKIVSPGTFVSYLGAVMLLQAPLKRLAKVNEIIQTGVAAARSIFRVMDLPEEHPGGDLRPEMINGNIKFSSVRFGYIPGGPPVLNDFNLEVSAGQTIALVGSSGSGKSTVVSLLLGFYQRDDGLLTIDGQPLEKYSKNELRRHVALVTQNNFLFDDSIANNITYGEPHIDSERLSEVIETAQLTDFIQTLDKGIDTRVGEQGGRLSGGQKQRVVIARALYRQAPILILDEATSSLDNTSEQLVRTAIDLLAGKRTIIVIAHRLSTIVKADRIYVIDKGRVVESGRHEELLQRTGAYSRLYYNQES
ncbi:MAG: lipid A export ATP-binding/permease protein MsbA [marine bacterium B5-7]|nr:MAG: lipid A export ATP-binding/permease protein MsbA [marine bacterium B5-7]